MTNKGQQELPRGFDLPKILRILDLEFGYGLPYFWREPKIIDVFSLATS